jgi:hypothetical protein
VTLHRVWHLGIEFGISLADRFCGVARDPGPHLLHRIASGSRSSLHAQMDSAANYPAQHVPTFAPRPAGTAMSRGFEMPNSVLSHRSVADSFSLICHFLGDGVRGPSESGRRRPSGWSLWPSLRVSGSGATALGDRRLPWRLGSSGANLLRGILRAPIARFRTGAKLIIFQASWLPG